MLPADKAFLLKLVLGQPLTKPAARCTAAGPDQWMLSGGMCLKGALCDAYYCGPSTSWVSP